MTNIDPLDPDWPDEPHLDPEDDPDRQTLIEEEADVEVIRKGLWKVTIPPQGWDWYEQDNAPNSPLDQDWG